MFSESRLHHLFSLLSFLTSFMLWLRYNRSFVAITQPPLSPSLKVQGLKCCFPIFIFTSTNFLVSRIKTPSSIFSSLFSSFFHALASIQSLLCRNHSAAVESKFKSSRFKVLFSYLHFHINKFSCFQNPGLFSGSIL